MTTARPVQDSAVSAIHTDTIEGILVVTLDVPGQPVNTLTSAMAADFGSLFARIDNDQLIRGVVIISGKQDSFIAGADIEQFLALRTSKEAEALSRMGQELLERLERLRVPSVAAIHGACLGGGLELALACTWRICSEHPKTLLALPEVQLGIIPGMGGTQRLPRVVGLQGALDMILTGRNIRAKRALQMGLVNDLVHPSILLQTAIARANALADRSLRRPRPKTGLATRAVLEANPVGRAVVFSRARKSVLDKTHGHYPAPIAAIAAVKAGYGNRAAGYEEEARRFGRMAVTDVSRQLVFLFFATTALKKDPGVEPPAPEPQPVSKLGILGAGFMGAGIASVAVQQGTVVRMKDTDPPRIARGMGAVRDVLKERLDRRQITRTQFDDMLVLSGGTTDYSGFGDADLVIEAVFEDLNVKHQVLREVEPIMPEWAIFASNTSTIPIGRIAEASARPDRVLGMHFFSPVHRMPLLEIIAGPATGKEAVATAVAYGKRLGKTVIVVNDGPGFYTTRVLGAYMNEAGRLLDEGAAIDQIDRALTDFGFPVGPMTLLDEVGIDIGGKVAGVLAEAFGPRMAPPDGMRALVLSGRTGRKGKSGLYRYDRAGKKKGPDPTVYEAAGGARDRRAFDDGEIADRCVLAMVNEAVRCLEEGILRSPRDGDIGAVFGLGFPPFRGGPFRYIDAEGADKLVRRLEELHSRFAPRFEPAEMLVEVARGRRKFYPVDARA